MQLSIKRVESGKTTTAVNLAACLGVAGKRALLVDTDPQGNATSGVGVVKPAVASCMYDVLINDEPIESVYRVDGYSGAWTWYRRSWTCGRGHRVDVYDVPRDEA